MAVTLGTSSKSSEEIFEQLSQIAKEESYFLSDIWTRSRRQFGQTWMEELVDNVVRLFGSERTGDWTAAIRGYIAFSLDTLEYQEFFEKNGRYRWSTLREIQDRFYENEAHMMKHYLPGMLLSHYLWPHHFKLLSFFRNEVVGALPSAPGTFYDVGIGTGLYSRELLRAFPQARGKGLDISRYSAAFTRRLLDAYGLAGRYEISLGDFFSMPPPAEQADLVVSQEVLEHLEDPERFIRILYGLARPGGRAYITAAVNAALSDHIYLFRSPEEVRELLTQAGWRILKQQAEYAYAGAPAETTPCVAAFFCER